MPRPDSELRTGNVPLKMTYDAANDIAYFQLSESRGKRETVEISPYMLVDVIMRGGEERIVGIEILTASKIRVIDLFSQVALPEGNKPSQVNP